MRRYADADTPPGHAHTRTAHPFLPDLHRSSHTLIIDPTRPTKHPQEYLVSKGFELADLGS